ncbi:Maf family protein [Candidatus Bipolaricaulota sp. J31]
MDYRPAFEESQRVVLASSSPRRIELLRLIVPEFDVRPPRVEEGPIRRPADLLRAARDKALAVHGPPDELVIGADTGVFHRGEHFGKPGDLEEARRMLARLSGDWHYVYTGLVVLREKTELQALVLTRVRFRALSPEEIEWYLSREDVLDKAGAYAIQGAAAAFVAEIRGDFTNVMGLPVGTLYRLLRDLGWRPVVIGEARG